jgi:galactokinase
MDGGRATYWEGQLIAAIAAFEREFDCRPTFAASAPGRVNLVGEHTDYNEGFVLPIAIDRQALIVAGEAKNNWSTCVAHDLHEMRVFDFQHALEPVPAHWSNHLIGTVQQFLQRGAKVPQLDLLLTSTVPIGAGLSSSAAIEVAMATLLQQVIAETPEPLETALLCQRAEHEFVGTPCGLMDMYIATHASPDHALLLDCRSNTSQPVRLPPPDEFVLLAVNTGVRHALGGGEYAVRRATCAAAARVMGTDSLRDATWEMVDSASMSFDERRKALHVIAENARTVLAATALSERDLRTFGELMFASHDSLRTLFEVSCPELDVIVDVARSMSRDRVFGARMTGGGFGGCAIVLCTAGAADSASVQIRRRFAERFGREPDIFAVRSAGAARSLPVRKN